MYEKVNPSHPDKVADRIAGAIVDLAYAKQKAPKVAVEVLLGHGECNIIIESSVDFSTGELEAIVYRLVKERIDLYVTQVPQDPHLANNQKGHIRCGDNGIFKGMPMTTEEIGLTLIAKDIYEKHPSDGKYIVDEKGNRLIICQSNAKMAELRHENPGALINPLGEWTGGLNVDSGATNRKLGSDMGGGVTGGGLHGKDLSKGDVSINIYAFLKAQKEKRPIELCCAIGDDLVDGRPYEEIVAIAEAYIKECGGFEKFAEWGLLGGAKPQKFFSLIK